VTITIFLGKIGLVAREDLCVLYNEMVVFVIIPELGSLDPCDIVVWKWELLYIYIL
jgi:hypothetical protein